MIRKTLVEWLGEYPMHGRVNAKMVRNTADGIGLGVAYDGYGAPRSVHVPGLVFEASGGGSWNLVIQWTRRFLELGAGCHLEPGVFAQALPVSGEREVPLARMARWDTPACRVAARVGGDVLRDFDRLPGWELAGGTLAQQAKGGYFTSPYARASEAYVLGVWKLAWALGYLGGGTRAAYSRVTGQSHPACRHVSLDIQLGAFVIRHGPNPEEAQAVTRVTFPLHAHLLSMRGEPPVDTALLALLDDV